MIGEPTETGGSVSLPSEAALARAAARTSPLADLLVLAAWLGPGRGLTETGMLRPEDVRAAVVELDLIPATTEAQELTRDHELRDLRAARDVPEFLTLWLTAVDLGLIEVHAGRAHPSAEVREGLSARRTLQVWAELFARGVEGDPDERSLFHIDDVDADLFAELLEGLQAAPDGAETSLTGPVEAHVEGLCAPGGRLAGISPDQLAWVRERFRQVQYLGALWFERCGGVRLVDRSSAEVREVFRGALRPKRNNAVGEVPEGGRIDCSVALTPLGRWGMRWIVSEERDGLSLHGLGSWDDTTEFLDDAVGLLDFPCGNPFIEKVTEWASGRSIEEAVRDLAESCAEPSGALRRGTARSALWGLNEPTQPHVRALLGSERRTVAGWAASALLVSRDVPEAEREALVSAHEPWLTIDSLAAALHRDESRFVDHLAGEAEGYRDPLPWGLLLDVERVRGADHPLSLTVLDALGRLHPDGTIAEGALRVARTLRDARGRG